jgi:branched-chain amino acid transport system ATP-binding protein
MSGIEVCDLRANYGYGEVLHGVSFKVAAGEIGALLGANGAGKTTTLLAMAGEVPNTGTVSFFGVPATGRLYARARAGVAFLPEQRGIIRSLTVLENLRLAEVDPVEVFAVSPELEPQRDRKAGLLSGGQQQILALTRAIVCRPSVLLVDELSFGLGPIVVARMLELARRAADDGAAVLIVDQFAAQVLRIADRGFVLRRGDLVLTGTATELLARVDEVEDMYLGRG